jgi:hypothetical protein
MSDFKEMQDVLQLKTSISDDAEPKEFEKLYYQFFSHVAIHVDRMAHQV